jgi:hypothetical protein
MAINQKHLALIEDDPIFLSTRFQGSKLKIVDWIWEAIRYLEFHTAFDAFGGAGSIGYMLKESGKKVSYSEEVLLIEK